MKRLFAILLFASTALCAAPFQDHTIKPEALSRLLAFFSIAHDENLIEETQEQWLRRPGQERWELTELLAEKKHLVLEWAREQGIFDPWTPSQSYYDKAFILGATTSRMELRLNCLKKLWQQGVRFQEIVWLTGDRPLDVRVDSLTDVCQTESEAAHILWERADLPQEMKQLPIVFVAVPMKLEGGIFKRPNTLDTIIAWQDRAEESCSCLFVSDQPFCGYQFSVIKGGLLDRYPFDLVGDGADPSSHPAAAAIVLDSIARWLYQDYLNAQNSSL